MKASSLLLLALGILACGLTWADAPLTFDAYQVILDRKPFGEAPPPPPQPPAPPPNPADSFAATLRMSVMIEGNDGGIRVGIIDQKTGKNFFLSVGDVEEGIELVSADFPTKEAVLRKGSEMAVVPLQSGNIKPLSAEEQQQRLNAPNTQAPSYAERRQARQLQRQMQQQPAPPPPPPQQPIYTGEELEKHLRDYQMEVIRQGLPPLPIPLTQEMDDQLVNEGVLPPP